MKTMTRTYAIIFALVLGFFSANGFAQDFEPESPPDAPAVSTFPSDDVAQVRLLLSAHHELPGKQVFDRVANVDQILYALASTGDAFTEDRALAALGYYPSSDVFLLYAKKIHADDTRFGTRNRTMMLIAEAFGDRALPVLRPHLDSDDLQLRMSAVVAIGSIGSDSAYALLGRRAAVEDSKLVLERIEESGRIVR